mmetsp:Transcript_15909/g.29876  ORF Transcript_15909/g.29876 Transcript_15909/m.29876 type:complete len:232 (-) Transcript_15909:398-1093(-)
MSGAATIEEQYETHLYSDFVESPDQSLLYSAYYHYSLFHLLNSVITSKASNLRVMDMACGNACIGRKVKQLNPSISVVGVDQSEAMLNEAQRLITQEGLSDNFSLLKCDIKYLPEDIGYFHCITSGFFLAHAPTRRELFHYFQVISEHLLPGGLTVHVIPLVNHLIPEGKFEKIRLEMHKPDKTSSALDIYNYHWSERTYRNAASTAGLTEISFQPGAICPRGYVHFWAMC